MPENDSPEDRIAKLIKRTAPRASRAEKASSQSGATITNSNVVSLDNVRVDRGDINLNVGTLPAPRTVVKVKTGVGTIDAKQKADITARLKRWLSLRNSIRKDKMSMGGAWAALNGTMGVNVTTN